MRKKSRAKNVFNFRTVSIAGDPKISGQSCGATINGQINKGESIRVFLRLQLTEQDIWQYIWLENIDIVPLYLAAERPVLERDGMLMMVDDDRIDLQPGRSHQKGWCASVHLAVGRHRGGGIPRANAAGNYRRDAGFYHQRAPGG